MPEPTDPQPTVAKSQDQAPSAPNSADETAPHGAGKPKFGPPAAPGEAGTLGPYRVVKRLGAGGMGAVYLAIDTRLDRKLALKVMLPEFAADRAARERFLREAKAAAKIHHDNVVTVYEADERDGVPYIAMQFLQGYPLDDYLKQKGAPALGHIIRIGREAAAGLSAAHELGLVHRDIKPANLWLEAPNGRVKVLDFGLAKPVGTDMELTKSGVTIGTPAYMSPEQARGLKVDARTDLFSLGAVLYRLCAGKTPFAAPNVMAVLMALANDDPTPVRELNPNVPEALAQLIHQLLAKKPDERPQTAAEVAKRLRAILDQTLKPSRAATEAVPMASTDTSGSLPIVVGPLPQPPPSVAPMQITAQLDNVFAHLEEADSPEAAAEADAQAPEPKSQRRAQSGGKGVLIGAAGAVLVAVGVVFGVVALMNKKPAPIVEDKHPEGDKGKPHAASDAWPAGPPWHPVPAGESPLDKLDPNEIPKEERFDWQPKELVAVIGSHGRRYSSEYGVNNLSVSPDGKWGASVGANQTIQLYEIATGKTVSHVRVPAKYGALVARAPFAPDGKTLWIETQNGLLLGRFEQGQWTFKPFGVANCDWPYPSPDGKVLILYSRDMRAQVWDVDGDRHTPRKKLDKIGHVQLGFSGDRQFLYVIAPTGPGKQWELEAVSLAKGDDSRRVVMRFPADTGPWHTGGAGAGPAMALGPDGKTLAVLAKAGWGNDCTLYDLTATPPKETARFKWEGTPEGHIRFSADGKTLYRRHTPIVRMDVSVNPPRPLGTIPATTPGAFTDTPDAKTLMVGDGSLVRFYDVSGEKPKEHAPLDGTSAFSLPYYTPAISTDSRVLLERSDPPPGVRRYQLWSLAGPRPSPALAPDVFLDGTHEFIPLGARWLETRGQPHQLFEIADGKWRRVGEPFSQGHWAVGCAAVPGVAAVAGDPGAYRFELWNVSGPKPHRAWTAELPELDTSSWYVFNASADGRSVATPRRTNGALDVVLHRNLGTKPEVYGVIPVTHTGGYANGFSPDGRYFVHNKVNATSLQVEDLTGRAPKEVGWVPIGDLSHHRIVFHPDGKKMVVAYGAGIGVFEIPSGKPLWRWEGPGKVMFGEFAPDGRHLMIHNANKTVYVVRLPDLADHDRAFTEWALPLGGLVTVKDADGPRELRPGSRIPAVFTVTRAYLHQVAKGRITDADVARLKGLTGLAELGLSNAAITEAGMKQLSELQTLTHLGVDGPGITDAGLKHVTKLRNLTHLWLSRSAVTGAGLATLKDLPALAVLHLDGTGTTDGDWELLAGLSGLTALDLKGTKVTLAGVQKLAQARPQCRIEWDGGTTEPTRGDRAATALALSLGGKATIKDAAGTKELAALKDLPTEPFTATVLNFANTKVADADLARLAGLTGLTTLHLDATPVSDAGLAHLKELPALTTLYVSQTKVTGEGLAHLKVLPALQVLWLNATGVTDAGLERLKGHPALTTLHLDGTKVTDEGLVHLKGSGLTRLSLWQTTIGDAGLEHLKGLTGLLYLGLNTTNVTDAGLARLKGMTELADLRLARTPVTDAGLARLDGLDKLTFLDLTGTKVTATGLRKLPLPKCRIEWPGGVVEPIATDRAVAAWALSAGAKVRLADRSGALIEPGQALPGDPLVLSGVDHPNCGASVIDADLAKFKVLPRLLDLHLRKASVTDAGVAHLRELTGLLALTVESPNVTDAALEHLTESSGLLVLDLRGTKVTLAGVQKLARALPGCRIEHGGGTIEPKK